MSNKKINMDKNIEKYTVKEFCEKYNGTNVEQTKIAYVEKIMNLHYVSYEMKITICEKIIDSSYYKKNNDIKKLYVNSPAKYMLYCLYLVKQYTKIQIDFSNTLEDFNLLNECGLLDIIYSNIPEKELKEFSMILDMVESDVLQNEYGTHAFVSKQVERFGELIGITLKPVIDKIANTLENITEEDTKKLERKIDKVLNKIK